VLCGVNIGLYGKDFNPPRTLTGLIKEIVKINSLHRLRLSSLEPSLVDEETIGLFYNNKLCPHLHFPFQSGDDMVLKRMNKKETVFLYEDIVNKIRKINPLFAISCDIIVGFPHEDEESFNNTIEFLKKVKPMRMHLFSFSPREKTPFFGIKKGNTSVTQRRYALLKKLAFDFSLEYRERFLGKILNMIVEEKKEGHLCGYTENYIKVYIKEKVPLGEAVHVRIKRVDKDKTFASIL
jgi:threonylcarbamoyladenosine tRNA methylthiotransferase MtaB